MKKVTSIDLYQAKEKCLELQATNNRLILKGNSSILITTTLLKDNPDDSKKFYNMLEISTLAGNNSISSSYLDALIMYLNENFGINGIIDYLPVADNLASIAKQISISRNYNDQDIQKITANNNIHVLLNFKIGDVIKGESASIIEKVSSYSYMGLTGISIELAKRLGENSLQNHLGYGGSPNAYEFEELGYKYTDDTITYNDKLFIGQIKGHYLSKKEIWPRSIELDFPHEDDTYNLEQVADVLIDYFAWIEQELKEKGPANAMSPMQPKVYSKD